MARVTFTDLGSVSAVNPDRLVGITDISVVQTAFGDVLYATGRGGSYLTSIEIGPPGTASDVTEQWQIPISYMQIESVEIVSLPSTKGDGVYLLGLNSDDLEGRHVEGDDIRYAIDLDAGAFDMGTISNIAFGAGTGFATLTTGGVVQISYDIGALTTQEVVFGGAYVNERATDLEVFTANDTDYAVVTYATENALALFEVQPGGTFSHVQELEAGDGLWVDSPVGLASITGLDGESYVIVASSGSNSLTVLQLSEGVLVPVDHRIDGLETRFNDASIVQTVEIGGRPYVVAAGSDMGLTVFGLLPGGALVEVGSVAATAETPINGITDLEVIAQGDGARFVIATQAAPYIVEFEMVFDALGITQIITGGSSSVSGGAGDDWLVGGDGNDTIDGGAGDDLITDGAGEDSLIGGDGADVFLLALDGSDDSIADFDPTEDLIEITGIPVGNLDLVDLKIRWWGVEITIGNELFSVYSAAGDGIPWSDILGRALVFSESLSTDPADFPNDAPNNGPEQGSQLGPTQLIGTPPEDQNSPSVPNIEASAVFELLGLGADDVMTNPLGQALDGRGGNDSIRGQGGNDTLVGGTGFDTLAGGGGDDLLSGGTFADSVSGGAGNDTLSGGDGFDQIFGDWGDDVLFGGASPDRIDGGSGNDIISAGSNFGYSVDGVEGGAGNDTIYGDAGFDLLLGGDGEDVMYGGLQADNVYGDAGNDTLIGGQGFDRLFGGIGDDVISGGTDTDGLFGGAGNDTMWGGSENDQFFMGQGDDIADGGDHDDRLFGNAGFDTLIGGAGDDQLWGNFNADRFVFGDGHGNDIIHDFEASNLNEVLDFSQLSSFNATSDVLEATEQVGGDVVITTGSSSSITLKGVDLADIDGTDFLF